VGSTTRYQWPYPDPSDPPDVATDLLTLASSLEETVGTLDDRLTTLDGLSNSVFQYTALTRVSSNIMEIPNAQWTPVGFDAGQYNLPKSNPGWRLGSPTRITCVQSGLYRFTGAAGFEVNGTGSRAIAVRVNGNASYPVISSGRAPDDIDWFGSVVVDAAIVTPGTWVELVVRQSSGGPLNLSTVQPRFGAQRLA